MQPLHTFESFINESVGPKFVEDFLTNKRESFSDRYQFYGWVRNNLPTVHTNYTKNTISYNDAKNLLDIAKKKYPNYEFNIVRSERTSNDSQVWCEVIKTENREVIYKILLGHATSIKDIDSMVSNFESKIKSLS